MKPERWQQIDQLLEAALERRSAERVAFLAEACAGGGIAVLCLPDLVVTASK